MLIVSLAVIVLSVLLDQITKHIAVTSLKPIDVHAFIPKIVEFNYETNEGIAWGMLQGQGWLFIPISMLAICLVIFFIVRFRKNISPLLSLALAMIAGGGIGNQIDRIVNGYVVDFLNFLFIDFPVFNVADCFVTVGFVLAVIAVIFYDRAFIFEDKPKKSDQNTAEK